GRLRDPVFSGNASITDGRIRHFSLPNALDAINGSIQFDSRGVRLDDVRATMGGGHVQFGGHIGFDGYTLADVNVTIRGADMHLRYPEGIRSTVNADLTVQGNINSPTLGGTVTVREATWNRRIDPTAGLFDFGGARPSGEPGGAQQPQVPLRFDVEVLV